VDIAEPAAADHPRCIGHQIDRDRRLICAELACSSTAMVGIATLTVKASTPNLNCAATTIASTNQRRDEPTLAETI
jgi:hypothetical protein